MRPAAAAATERGRTSPSRAGLACAVAMCVVEASPAFAGEAAKSEAGEALSGATIETSAELSTYADTDNVTVVTPTARVGLRDDADGWRIGGRYLVDVVSAASVDI